MRRIIYCLFALLLSGVLFSMQSDKARKIVFFGDSITAGASKENGFITLLQKEVGSNVELVNAGVGGNKVTDLYLRFEKDVLAENPTEVVIWIGINDVWHQDRGVGTDLRKFPVFYQEMISRLTAKKIQVVLCTPSVIGELNDNSNHHDGDLNAYSKVVRKLAADNNCKLIDLRKLFTEYEVKNNPNNEPKGILTRDGVHLNDKGNRFIADIFKRNLNL